MSLYVKAVKHLREITLDAEQLLPNRRELRFESISRRDVRLSLVGVVAGIRQGVAIDLSVRLQRQCGNPVRRARQTASVILTGSTVAPYALQ
jgi:hypothetical protein